VQRKLLDKTIEHTDYSNKKYSAKMVKLCGMDAAKIFFSTAPIVFDITIVSLLVYFFIWVIRRLKLSSVLYGFLTLIAIFLISSVLHLKLTLLLFSYFTNVAVIVLCIIFQREIRKYLEVLSIKSLRTYRPIARTETFRAIEDSVHELAAQKTGALIVIKGSDPLNRFILNETELNGQLSYPLSSIALNVTVRAIGR
jgi:diadenylate cyclase